MKFYIVHVPKRKFTVSLLLLFIFLCLFFIFLCIKAGNAVSAETMPPSQQDGYCIVIDAGHGGEDGGAVAINGVLEKEINLKIALILNDLLRSSGYSTMMIRDQDEDLADQDLSTVRERKISDLHNRSDQVNNTSNAILVSIHQNYFEKSQYSGAQVFYSTNHEDSANLGEAIRAQLVACTQPENTRELKQADRSIYLLKQVECPAVIVECGFLSNQEETEKLCTPEYQSQIAFSLYKGICDYLSED